MKCKIVNFIEYMIFLLIVDEKMNRWGNLHI